MISAAAFSMSAVSSTTTGGFPGPAAMTRFPAFMAAFTTAGPPVTHNSATVRMVEQLFGRLDGRFLDGRYEVRQPGLPLDLLIEQIRAHKPRIWRPPGCGLKTAVFPPASTLIALLAIVGTE